MTDNELGCIGNEWVKKLDHRPWPCYSVFKIEFQEAFAYTFHCINYQSFT